MKAAPDAQLRLLELQAVDSALDRCEHRRAALPELAEGQRLAQRAGELTDLVALADAEMADVARVQAKAEADVEQVRARADRDRQRLDSGSVGSAKELGSLQSELSSLARRQAELEDVLLEVMQRREDAEARLAGLRAEVEQVRADEAAVAVRRDDALAAIGVEQDGLLARRAALLADLPEDLIALYERLRPASDGVAAAALRRGRCDGCHLQLTTADLNALRAAPDDEVVRCEECRRVLVRTSESGL